jgi:hypothetical protein
MSTDRDDPMQAFNPQSTRAPVQPFTPVHYSPLPSWPFPAAPIGRPSTDVTANARKVIATTARAFLGHFSS